MADFNLDLDLELLSNPDNFMNKKSLPTDDNEEIIRLIKDRMSLGKQRYGHGVIVDEDTTKYGTNTDDWELMALEEMLDGMIYSTAAIIRYRRKKLTQKHKSKN